MLLSLPIGTTSKIIQFPVFDSSSTTGALLAGLVFNSAGLTAYYNREGAAGASVAITLATATKGTWATGGFVAVDGTNMPGWYELHIPDAALASGARSVSIHLRGATNMVPVPILIELTATSNQDAVRGGMTALPNVASGSAGAVITSGTGTAQLSVAAGLVTLAGVTHTGAVIPTVSTLTGHTAQTGDAFARLGAPAGASVSADVAAVKVDTAAVKVKTDFLPSATAGAAGGVFIAGTNAATTVTTSFTTTFTGNLTGSVASVTGAVGSVTGGVTVATNNDKTGYALTQAFPANFSAMSISATTGLVDITQAAADKVWATAARVLTAGTNISLAKGTGVTGFNDLDAAGVAGAVWNAATLTYGAAGSYGLLVETNLDAAITSRMATYTQPAGFLVATFPSAVASPTNITAASGITIATGGIGSGAIAAGELNNIADGFLNRVLSAGVDSGADNTTARTVRQALRGTRNRIAIAAGVATVYKEDDVTVSHTAAVTNTAGNPVSEVNPT